jgi:hypothetical protein
MGVRLVLGWVCSRFHARRGNAVFAARRRERTNKQFGIDPVWFGPRSGPVCVPTQSVGTRKQPENHPRKRRTPYGNSTPARTALRRRRFARPPVRVPPHGGCLRFNAECGCGSERENHRLTVRLEMSPAVDNRRSRETALEPSGCKNALIGSRKRSDRPSSRRERGARYRRLEKWNRRYFDP